MPRTAKPWDDLTPQQQRNRLKNERAKQNRENKETKRMAPFRIVDREEMASAVDKKVVQGPSISSVWIALAKFFILPSSVFSILGLAGLTVYLVHQFAIHGELGTGLIVEGLAVIYAIIHATSSSNLTRAFSSAGIVATLCFAGSTLHTSMVSASAASDTTLADLRENRSLVIAHISSLQDSYASLPDDYITAKRQTSEALSSARQDLAKIEKDLAAYVPSSSVDFSSVIIRLMAMLASMVLIHGLIARMHESVKA